MASAERSVGQGWERQPMAHGWVPLSALPVAKGSRLAQYIPSLRAAHFQCGVHRPQQGTMAGGHPSIYCGISQSLGCSCPTMQSLFLSKPVCLQTLKWEFGSQTTHWLATDRVPIISGRCHWGVVKTVTGGEWNGIQTEGNTLMGAVSRALECFKGNSNYKDYGIRWLLLSVVDALETDKEIQLVIMAKAPPSQHIKRLTSPASKWWRKLRIRPGNELYVE